MINTAALQKYFTDDFTPRDFAEQLHSVMADYTIMACYSEGNADMKKVGLNIDFLEDFRRVVLECETADPEE